MSVSAEEAQELTEIARGAVSDLDAAMLIRDPAARRAAVRALFDANISWIRRRALVEAALELIVTLRSR